MQEFGLLDESYIAILFVMSIAGVVILAEGIRRIFNINLWEESND